MTEGFTSGGPADGLTEKDNVDLSSPAGSGRPDDVGPRVVFLASADARWITGETIIVSVGE
jgi:NAD(P)-dependent dehydrogenase (short-subunit alcohol dehydrogenase family)